MVAVLGLVVYLIRVRKSADVPFGEVNVQSKPEVQLIFKTESVHKQYHTQNVEERRGKRGLLNQTSNGDEKIEWSGGGKRGGANN